MLQLYTYIGLFELDSSVLANPACYDHYPFAKQLQFFVGSLLLCLAVVVGVALSRLPGFQNWRHSVRLVVCLLTRVCVTLTVVMYPLITSLALGMVNCVSLNGRYVLAASSYYECYTGDHARVGGLAWIILLLHVVGFPVGTYLYLSRCGNGM